MKKAFVTGGTGFIGRALVAQLVARDYSVTALARTPAGEAILTELGARPVRGDITQRESMRAGMAGCDVVFHVAAWYEIGIDDRALALEINVDGTRNVLTLALELNIPRVVYTSTIAVFGGVQRNFMPDESYRYDGPFDAIYDETKWLAHYQVALPLIEQGAPITIVMPGLVYGPGDHSLMTDLMRLFYQGALPVVLGPDSTFCFAHVEDVALGHILAAEKGKVGESYILAGPAIPLDELFDFWANLTGKPRPFGRIPARFVRPLAPVMGRLRRPLALPSAMSDESVTLLGKQYVARSDKARSELGWRERSLQAGMLQTFKWIAATTPPFPIGRKELSFAAASAAATLFVLWLAINRAAIVARRARS